MIELMVKQLWSYAEDQAVAHEEENRLTRILLTMSADGVLILDNGSFTHFPGK